MSVVPWIFFRGGPNGRLEYLDYVNKQPPSVVLFWDDGSEVDACSIVSVFEFWTPPFPKNISNPTVPFILLCRTRDPCEITLVFLYNRAFIYIFINTFTILFLATSGQCTNP
jgi:hypothetical protein